MTGKRNVNFLSTDKFGLKIFKVIRLSQFSYLRHILSSWLAMEPNLYNNKRLQEVTDEIILGISE
jgi:hypothetical protein